MDTTLPVWSRPHTFTLLDVPRERPLEVFTFGLVLTQLRPLATPAGVEDFGQRFGLEWLPSLAGRIRQLTKRPAVESGLARYLEERVGLSGLRLRTDPWPDGAILSVGPPPPAMIAAFAAGDGALISQWSLNAFDLLDVELYGLATRRQRVPPWYSHTVRRLNQQAEMRHELEEVNGLDGRPRWAYRYRDMFERIALEVEDLTIRQPTLRRCRLCRRPFVPLVRGQSFCAGSLWSSVDSRRLIARCVSTDELRAYENDGQGEDGQGDYRKRRKTAWTQMQREVLRSGKDSKRGGRALTQWEAWKLDNPSPHPPGRRRQAPEAPAPPFTSTKGD